MKNYFIVGASSGIGKSLANQLASDGNQVFGTYFNHEQSASENLEYHQLDVTSPIELDFLPESIDGVVYCPGSINLMPFKRIKIEEFAEDYNLQVLGAIRVIQAILPKLKNADSPSIVLFSTVAVQSGFNFHSQVSSSKGAIEGLTRALAAEFAPKIRVNAIAPSITNTPLAEKLLNSDQKIEANNQRHAMGRVGTPEDIAQTASFLLSEDASWITGQIMHVDGGMSSVKK